MTVDGFDELLRAGRERYMASHGIAEWIGRSVTDDEAHGVLTAVDAGLVRISEDGLAIELVGFPPRKKPKQYQLFGHWHGRAYWSWAEAFIQITFAAELVLLHLWPAERVRLEMGLDVGLLGTRGSPPVLLAEAKVDPRDLDYVMTLMKEMATTSLAHTRPKPRTKEENAVNKYLALVRFRPQHYVEVAPGVRRAHRLTFTHREEGAVPSISFAQCAAIPANL